MTPNASPTSPAPTSPQPGHATVEALLAHRQWVRSLARSLVRDESSADDVEQRTWLAALESPPQKLSAARAWLGSVVRRTVLESQRKYVRRQRRELAAARPEGLPSAADVVARVEIDRDVVNSVAELDEPYRTTLLLRFYDGLPPRDVAEKMGVPVETVRTRVRRGLERVRAGLDGRHGGDRDAWKAALVPFLAGPGGAAVADDPHDAPVETAAGSGNGATAGAIVAVAVTLAAGVFAGLELQATVDSGGRRSGRLVPTAAMVADAKGALESEREHVAELRTGITETRAAIGEREAVIEELRLAAGKLAATREPAAAEAAVQRTAFEPPFTFPEYDRVMSDVPWDEVGEHVATMVPLLGEIYAARLRGADELRPETVGDLQARNGALVEIVVPLDSSFPGRGLNAAITHPAFAATMAAAVCHVRDVPLDAAQVTALDRIAKDASDELRRALEREKHGYRIAALIAETEIKLAFAAKLRGLLRPAQRVLFGSEATTEVLGYDLLGPGQIWITSVEAGTFPSGMDVSQKIAEGLGRELGLNPGVKTELESVVRAWFDALPEDYLGAPRRPYRSLRDAHPSTDVIDGAKHMLDLMERIGALDLSDAARASVENSKMVLILRRAN